MVISRDDVLKLFVEQGGTRYGEFTAIHTWPKKTPNGTPYLTKPGVALIGKTKTNLSPVRQFLEGFESGFEHYLDDEAIDDAAQLSKFSGQLCYMSFGDGRTKNDKADKYFDNIRSSGHGSVLEHPNFSLLFYGDSRSQTHEAVRHRAGFGFSQVSQRYVDGKCLRFIERPEYQEDEELHDRFIKRIDYLKDEYEWIANKLIQKQLKGDAILSAERKTDLRKKVNQCARSALPNETEAAIVITANSRAWRHFFEMRANEHAEIEIRTLAFKAFLCICATEPTLFRDYEIKKLDDGTYAVATTHRKV